MENPIKNPIPELINDEVYEKVRLLINPYGLKRYLVRREAKLLKEKKMTRIEAFNTVIKDKFNINIEQFRKYIYEYAERKKRRNNE